MAGLLLLLPLFGLSGFAVINGAEIAPNRQCLFPSDPGTCARIGWDGFKRYFYNSTSKQCDTFIYTGCGGNNNRFDDQPSCESACAFYLNPANEFDNPLLPQVTVDQITSRLCNGLPLTMPMMPTGNYVQCGSDKGCPVGFICKLGPRNYPPIAICCPNPNSTALTTTPGPTQADLNPLNIRPEWCLLPPVPGPCRQISQMWYYDAFQQRCMTFAFGGCRGNENRFASRSQCETACPPLVVILGTTPDTPLVTTESWLSIVPKNCQLGPNSGEGYNYVIKYYFEQALGSCVPFSYGGCGGNENRFDNEITCLAICRPEMAAEAKSEAERKGIKIDLNQPWAKSEPCPSFPTSPDDSQPRLAITPAKISYFRHPSGGYTICPNRIRCVVDPCETARCPAYPNAICRPNPCYGCLAQFTINNHRVNCSLPYTVADGLVDVTKKPGMCPSATTSQTPCPNDITDPQGAIHPYNNLCSTDSECFADQKCCLDPCYERINSFPTCQTPIRFI